MENRMKLQFSATTQNESFARICVASFCAQMDPPIDILTDIKTAVSEAVTNSIVHAYPDTINGIVEIEAVINGNNLIISVNDYGVGIENIEQARMPFYTSKPNNERSGIGFTVMEGFMDSVEVKSTLGRGTSVVMRKTVCNEEVKVGG